MRPFRLKLLVVAKDDSGLHDDDPSLLVAITQRRYWRFAETTVELKVTLVAAGLPEGPDETCTRVAVAIAGSQVKSLKL